MFKKIISVIYWSCLLFLVAVAVATALTVFEAPGGYKLFLVSSGSMEPSVKIGSVVVVAPQENYVNDDVVTFLAAPDANFKKSGSTVTHRIIKVANDEEGLTFQTKGDANKTPDPSVIKQDQILGKVLFSIPWMGYLVAFAKTQVGFIALIIIPMVLIIYNELANVKKELSRIIEKKKKSKLNLEEKIEEKVDEKIIAAEETMKKVLEEKK